MKRATLRTINAYFKKMGMPVTLYRGKGYQYLIFDTPDVHESRSVMVNHISDLSYDQWIEEGKDFFRETLDDHAKV